jgi:hypothetical protein
MEFDWKSIVKTIAPLVGTALGGPMGGMAAKVVSSTLLGREDATDEELSLAVMNASPEQLLPLKQANIDFKVTMKKLGISEKKLAYDDADSARRREIAVGDNTPKILAYMLTVLFAAALGGMYFIAIPEENTSMINMMVGSLGTVWIAAMAYYHGSSRGSRLKDLNR